LTVPKTIHFKKVSKLTITLIKTPHYSTAVLYYPPRHVDKVFKNNGNESKTNYFN